MGLTSDDIQKALRVRRTVKEYFETSHETKVQAKELMKLFMEKGIFTKNTQDGLQIREFLKYLDEQNHLHLIPQIYFEQNKVSKSWFFIESSK
jgi:F0F1-type ATP synthase delta subunit